MVFALVVYVRICSQWQCDTVAICMYLPQEKHRAQMKRNITLLPLVMPSSVWSISCATFSLSVPLYWAHPLGAQAPVECLQRFDFESELVRILVLVSMSISKREPSERKRSVADRGCLEEW